jgi:hypothetical protein
MSLFRNSISRLRHWITTPAIREMEYTRPDAATQVMLRLAYQDRIRRGEPLPSFRDVGFKAYSQTDEDGILWYIFSLIGETNRISVELCAGDGQECNSASLMIHHGWHGLLVDGNPSNVAKAEAFYFSHKATRHFPPKTRQAWITAENVNELVSSNGFSGEIDLLTIDVDGMDYWLWKALTVVRPRVVVMEYNTSAGPDQCVTVPYQPDFNGFNHSVTCGMPDYAGASLAALISLGREKGYRFVGTNRADFNGFFVRDDLGVAELPMASLADAFSSEHARWCMTTRWPKVRGCSWQAVP